MLGGLARLPDRDYRFLQQLFCIGHQYAKSDTHPAVPIGLLLIAPYRLGNERAVKHLSPNATKNLTTGPYPYPEMGCIQKINLLLAHLGGKRFGFPLFFFDRIF